MAGITIPMLPMATSLSGAEQFEIVQDGMSRRATTGQLTGTAPAVLALLAEPSGATRIGTAQVGTAPSQNLQEYLKYMQPGPFVLKMGYGSGGIGLIAIGANDGTAGQGALQLGGAGRYDSGNGSYLLQDGHPNWNVVQSSIPFNPTEFNIYGNGNGGVAVSAGTTTITRSTGREWGSFMNGLTLWFNGIAYTVSSATASSAVLSSAPPAGTACWQYVYTTGSGTCTVAAGVVTRVIGDPFIPRTFGAGFTFKLNGTAYTVTASTSGNSCTISSPPADGTYTYTYRTDINAQVATFRVQLTAGADEENVNFYARPDTYVIGAQASGFGKLRDLRMTSEYTPVLSLAAYGKYVSLGGVTGAEALRCLFNASGAVNRIEMTGGATGAAAAFAARGADTNVSIAFDTQGTGSVSFTSGSFARRNFRVFGSAGGDNLAVDAATGAPFIVAEGASANVDIRLLPKGAGTVWLGAWTSNADAAVNGYVLVKDFGGTLRKVATIA